LNNCQFKQLEDLKNIPGLPVTYYERFMKVSCIGKGKLCVVIKYHISELGDNAEVDVCTGWRGVVGFIVRLFYPPPGTKWVGSRKAARRWGLNHSYAANILSYPSSEIGVVTSYSLSHMQTCVRILKFTFF
jgi:hypothetical protein